MTNLTYRLSPSSVQFTGVLNMQVMADIIVTVDT